MIETAKRIMAPYTIDYKYCDWWSLYKIGQQISPKFSVSNQIFLAGDAIHTQSSNLGQGMNVSIQDAYNIGWKLGAVLTGTAKPSILSTYETERRQVVLELLNADREVARFYARDVNKTPPTPVPRNGAEPDNTTTTTPAPPSPSSTFPSFFRGPWDEELGWDYDRIFVDEVAAHDKECGFAYLRLGIDRERGCLVGVRPDQHVGWVGGLGDVEGLGRWLGGVLVERE